jgi:hypothetical protein
MDMLPMRDEQAKAFAVFNESQRKAGECFAQQADEAITRAMLAAEPKEPHAA